MYKYLKITLYLYFSLLRRIPLYVGNFLDNILLIFDNSQPKTNLNRVERL